MHELTRLPATDILSLILHREVSVTEVVEAHLRAIEANNPVVNALTQIDESCLDSAHQMDSTMNSMTDTDNNKNPPPLLFGLPVTTKSNVDQRGFVNSNGVPAFANNHCTEDSAVVSNLKSSGAIIMGRSNTPEFSMRWCTSNPLNGITLNPWNKDATPGGSSGGAAAAVATGMCALAHGNDLGGSLRYPAYCCGITSLKPSAGRIPAFNPGAAIERPALTQSMSVQGPLARTVADVRLGFQAMAGAAGSDPLWVGTPHSGRQHADTLKVGFAMNPFSGSIDTAVEKSMNITIDALRGCGAEVSELALPDAEGTAQLWGNLLFTETSMLLGDTIKEHSSAQMNRLMDAYGSYFELMDLEGLLKGMAERIQRQRAWSAIFDSVDLLLMPTSMSRPFENDLDFSQPESIPGIIGAQKPLYIINLLGLPAIAMPTHLENGTPLGIQLIGAKNDDEFLLDSAQRLEQELGTLISQLPQTT